MDNIQQFPKVLSKAPKTRTIQDKLRQEPPTKKHVISRRSYTDRKKLKKRPPKKNVTVIRKEKQNPITINSGEELYCYNNWSGQYSDKIENISPPTKIGRLVDIEDYTEVDSIDGKNVIVLGKGDKFIAGKATRNMAKQFFGNGARYVKVRETIHLLQNNKPSSSRGKKTSGTNTSYNLSGNRKDPLRSGVIGEYAFKPGTPEEVKQQCLDGVRGIVEGMEGAGRIVTRALLETEHYINNVKERLALESIGEKERSVATQFASGENYWSQCHTDDDFYFTSLSVMSKSEDDNEEVMYYFVFPEYKLKVPLKPGDVMVFNPLEVHSCSNCRIHDSHIFSAYVSKKTVMTGGIRIGVQFSKCFTRSCRCGDSVTDEIDDIDFITNGVVEMFLYTLGGINSNDVRLQQRANVVATGFSNGGFMSSLIGLQSASTRPPWLVGIVPISGYQYDIELYNGNPTKPLPLPMMAHHGARDKVVNPDGCCLIDNTTKSNCQFGIGNKQDSCTSAKSAFDMWSLINGCILDAEDVVQSLRVNKEDDLFTCWKGQDCIETTNFCLWNKEGHNPQFPGIEMTQTWIENVFRHAELQSNNIVEEYGSNSDHDDELIISYAAAISYYESHPKEGRRVFYTSIILSALALLLCMYKMQRIKACSLYYKQRKKTEIERR